MTPARILSAVRRTALALLAAVATAVVLAGAWFTAPRLWSQWFGPPAPAGVTRTYLIPTDAVAWVSAALALDTAAVAALLAAPLWLLLVRLRRNGVWSAIGLGVVLAEAGGLAMSLPQAPSPSFALALGLIGAMSAAAAWAVTKGEVFENP